MITINLYLFGSLEVHPSHAQQIIAKGLKKYTPGLTRCQVPTGRLNERAIVYLPSTTVAALKAAYCTPVAEVAAAALTAAQEPVQEPVAKVTASKRGAAKRADKAPEVG